MRLTAEEPQRSQDNVDHDNDDGQCLVTRELRAVALDIAHDAIHVDWRDGLAIEARVAVAAHVVAVHEAERDVRHNGVAAKRKAEDGGRQQWQGR